MEGRGWRGEVRGKRVERGGWREEGGEGRLEGGGWRGEDGLKRVERGGWREEGGEGKMELSLIHI